MGSTLFFCACFLGGTNSKIDVYKILFISYYEIVTIIYENSQFSLLKKSY